MAIRNDGDADVKVDVEFELTPGWVIRGFGWPEFRRAPLETTARAGTVSEHWFRLASPGPRRDARVELRLRVKIDGLEQRNPPPSHFEVTTLGEPLCH